MRTLSHATFSHATLGCSSASSVCVLSQSQQPLGSYHPDLSPRLLGEGDHGSPRCPAGGYAAALPRASTERHALSRGLRPQGEQDRAALPCGFRGFRVAGLLRGWRTA